MSSQQLKHYTIEPKLVFGRGWADTEPPFGRLPAYAGKMVPEKVWKMRRNSSGMYVVFRTNSTSLHICWELADDDFGEMNFNVCSFSGVDLFCFDRGKWRYAVAANAVARCNDVEMLTGMSKKERRFRLYLPNRNCLKKLAAAVDDDASFEWEMPDGSPQIVYYGSSIIHGSCASRAGNGITALLGRAFDLPVVNLGFSGAARLEVEVATVLADTDGCFYIVDPLPNCDTLLINERLEKFLRILCSAHPDKPVFLLTDADRRGAWIFPSKTAVHRQKRSAARKIVERLKSEYPLLHLIDMARSMGSDSEGTVDGIHPDELGVYRFTTYLLRKLRQYL